MANSQYSADSAPPPQSLSPSSRNKKGAVTLFNVPASSFTDILPAPKSYVLTGMTAYIGVSQAMHRMTDRVSVHRMSEQSGAPTPNSID